MRPEPGGFVSCSVPDTRKGGDVFLPSADGPPVGAIRALVGCAASRPAVRVVGRPPSRTCLLLRECDRGGVGLFDARCSVRVPRSALARPLSDAVALLSPCTRCCARPRCVISRRFLTDPAWPAPRPAEWRQKVSRRMPRFSGSYRRVTLASVRGLRVPPLVSGPPRFRLGASCVRGDAPRAGLSSRRPFVVRPRQHVVYWIRTTTCSCGSPFRTAVPTGSVALARNVRRRTRLPGVWFGVPLRAPDRWIGGPARRPSPVEHPWTTRRSPGQKRPESARPRRRRSPRSSRAGPVAQCGCWRRAGPCCLCAYSSSRRTARPAIGSCRTRWRSWDCLRRGSFAHNCM